MNKQTTLGDLGNVLLVVAAGVATNGYVISTLWNWYAVSAFGVPSLSFKIAAGLCILWAVASMNLGKEDRNDNFIELAWTTIAAKWLGLGLGWAVWSAL